MESDTKLDGGGPVKDVMPEVTLRQRKVPSGDKTGNVPQAIGETDIDESDENKEPRAEDEINWGKTPNGTGELAVLLCHQAASSLLTSFSLPCPADPLFRQHPLHDTAPLLPHALDLPLAHRPTDTLRSMAKPPDPPIGLLPPILHVLARMLRLRLRMDAPQAEREEMDRQES